MTERDDLSMSAPEIVVHPVPDFRASADSDDPKSGDTVSDNAAPKRRRRIIGGSPDTSPGSKDSNPKGAVKDAPAKRPIPPMPNGPRGFAPGIEKVYATIAMAVMPFDMQMATAIMEVAPKAAEAWNDLAKTNPAIRRMLYTMMQTTATGALIAAHMPIIAVLISRKAGNDPRMSMIAAMMGQQAEDYANEEAA